MAVKIADEKARESLGMSLRICRRIENISLKDLQELTGINSQTLKNYEEGKTVPDAFAIYALAQTYGVTVESLFSDKLEKAWYEFLEKIRS